MQKLEADLASWTRLRRHDDLGRETVDYGWRVVVGRSKLENPEGLELLPRYFFVRHEPGP
jgi:hypothetical protein